MKKRPVLSAVLLIITALIWGTAFVAQDAASEYLGTFTINGIRFMIGGLFLIPIIIITQKKLKRPVLENKEDRKTLIISSVVCGIALGIAANIQQFGIESYPDEAATSGRAGFITAMYVILVPLISFIIFRKKISFLLFIALVCAVAGLYLLCFSNGISGLYTGDLIILLCALAFSVHILAVDHFIDRVNPLKLSCFSFLICGLISTVLMFIFEKPSIDNILLSWKSLLYLGIFSSGIAYTLQVIAQRYSTNPTVASILMSLESVFAVLAGSILMNERLTLKELIGCLIMFIAIILAQLPSDIFKKTKKA